MGVVISFLSLKGGVGKTTISAAVASSLAAQHKNVLLIDANYSAPNLGYHMDLICPGDTIHDVLSGSKLSSAVYRRHGVDLVPGNFLYSKDYHPLKLRAKIQQARKDYDFIVIDSSPSLNEELLSALYASDEVFLVTTPDYPTLSCSIKLARVVKQRGQRLSGILVNRSQGSKYQLSLPEIQESTGIPVVLLLPEDSAVMKSLSARVPVPLYAKNSSFSRKIERLTNSLLGIPENRSLWKKIWPGNKEVTEVNREVLREHFYTSIFTPSHD